jgi:hypothetical protein
MADVPLPLGFRTVPGLSCQLHTSHNCSSQPKLLYDWRLTANQFLLASTPLRPTTRGFSFPQLNCYGINPYVTSWLTKRWVCLLWICLAFRQVYISHIWHVIEKLLLLHYAQVLCQYRLCRAYHACLTYLLLQQQPSHLNGRKLNHLQV